MSVSGFQFDYKRSIAIDPVTRRPILDPMTGLPEEVFHPFIPCLISSKCNESESADGLLDSGSDFTVIPISLAESLRLDLKPARIPMMVANGSIMDRFTSEVLLSIGRGGRYSSPVKVEVTVPVEGNPPVLIGRDTIFRLYTILFIEAEKRVEMKLYRAK